MPVTHATNLSSSMQLAVRTSGAGAPLVLLHGGTGSWSHWSRNITAFANDFRVHAFDLPGFGQSPDVANDIDIDGYIDVVAASIEAVTDHDKYHLAGFSFGGVVAAGVAARHGDRIETLTLAGPGGFGNAIGRKLDVRGISRKASAGEARGVIRHNLLQIMLAHPATIDDATIDLQLENISRARFDSRPVSHAPRLTDDLRRSHAPLHVIWGALDQLAYPSIANRADIVRAARPDAQIDLIPDAGHWVQHERPTAFNDTFLNYTRSKRA